MTQFNCPHCGRPIQVVKAGGSPWSVEPTYFSNYGDRTNHRFGDVADPSSVPQFSRAERRTPSRVPTKESDVWVPAFKALLTGALIGMPAGVACAVAWELPWWSPVAVASVTTGAAWLLFLARSEGTLWVIEKIINQDVTGDGQIGRPENTWRVKGELKQVGNDGEEHWDLFDLPAPSPGYLQMFAKALLDGDTSFSERGSGEFGYSREMWLELRDEFLSRSWAVWRHPNEERQGVHLTQYGRAVLRAIAEGELPH